MLAKRFLGDSELDVLEEVDATLTSKNFLKKCDMEP